jgi:transposase-like protein
MIRTQIDSSGRQDALATSEIGIERGATLPGPEWSGDERSETQRNGGPGSVAGGGKSPGPGRGQEVLDPEVSDRPVRRRHTMEYKRRILKEADACARGELGALLRREGLYSSLLSAWRRDRDLRETQALTPKKRGPKVNPDAELIAENERLHRENLRLERRLHQAETIIEVQKKVSELLGIPLNTSVKNESD